MGRKTEKSLTKKYKLKTKKQQMSQIAQYLRSHNVNVANRTEDPMKELAGFKKFERNGLQLTVSCEKTHTLNEETTDFIFSIWKETMKPLWNRRSAEAAGNGFEKFAADWEWDEKRMIDSVYSDGARFLVAKDAADGKPVGFVYFQFEKRNDDEVLYVYELILEDEVRRKGLGKHLLMVLELMTYKLNLSKLQTTSWHDNAAAKALLTDCMKFSLDETAPQTLFYEVLCKINKKKKIITPQMCMAGCCA